MSVEVLPDQQVNLGNNIRHKAGEIIHDLADDVKAELIKLGVVKDLEQPAAPAAPPAPAAPAPTDKELQRGQVGEQMKAAANQDVADAERTLRSEGEKVGVLPAAEQPAAPAAPPAPAAPAE